MNLRALDADDRPAALARRPRVARRDVHLFLVTMRTSMARPATVTVLRFHRLLLQLRQRDGRLRE